MYPTGTASPILYSDGVALGRGEVLDEIELLAAVEEVLLGSRATIQRMNSRTIIPRSARPAPLPDFTGAPQPGQLADLELISLPHSLHLINAIAVDLEV
jgi:hypothetical protein